MRERVKKSKSSFIIFIIIIILVYIVPLGISTFQDIFENDTDTMKTDLEIVEIKAEIVSDYNGKIASDGYTMYRFDITVDNKGNQDEKIKYTPFYIESGDGSALMQYEEYSETLEDTRILPQGRRGMVTVFAEVSQDSTNVEVINYGTPDGKREEMVYSLQDIVV